MDQPETFARQEIFIGPQVLHRRFAVPNVEHRARESDVRNPTQQFRIFDASLIDSRKVKSQINTSASVFTQT